jgi:hypothetical protein
LGDNAGRPAYRMMKHKLKDLLTKYLQPGKNCANLPFQVSSFCAMRVGISGLPGFEDFL